MLHWLELGESWEECASRETAEETNLSLSHFRLIHVTNDPNMNGDRNKHYITIFMTARTSEPELVVNMEPHKCESWDWYPWSKIVDMCSNTPESLFEPMIHLVMGLNVDESEIFKYET